MIVTSFNPVTYKIEECFNSTHKTQDIINISAMFLKIFRRQLLLIICSIMIVQVGVAQSVGIGTSSPNVKSVLDLNVPNPATNPQGLLLPRLTTTQRTNMSLSTTEQGMLVYDITDNSLYAWSGTAWQTANGADNDWVTNTNFTYDNSGRDIGIGTPSPSQLLTVHTSDNNDGISLKADNGLNSYFRFWENTSLRGYMMMNGTSHNISVVANAGDLILEASAASITLDATNGYVGVNQSSPSQELEVGGDVLAESYLFPSVEHHYITLTAADFVGENTGTAAWAINSANGHAGYFNGSLGGLNSSYAGLHLPEGAIIDSLTMSYTAGVVADLSAELFATAINSGGAAPISSVNGLGGAATGQIVKVGDINHTVDNKLNRYFIRYSSDAVGASAFLISVQVYYSKSKAD